MNSCCDRCTKQNKYNKEYQKNNPEKYKEASKKYYNKNKEVLLQKQKERDNSDIVKQKKKQYYQDNKERLILKSKERYQKNLELNKKNQYELSRFQQHQLDGFFERVDKKEEQAEAEAKRCYNMVYVCDDVYLPCYEYGVGCFMCE